MNTKPAPKLTGEFTHQFAVWARADMFDAGTGDMWFVVACKAGTFGQGGKDAHRFAVAQLEAESARKLNDFRIARKIVELAI